MQRSTSTHLKGTSAGLGEVSMLKDLGFDIMALLLSGRQVWYRDASRRATMVELKQLRVQMV